MSQFSLLVIDDEAAICEMLATALEMAGFRVHVAHNAADGLNIIYDEQPDLLLLDWMLPGTSGIELARRLKRDSQTAALPIIMLTARGEEDNKIQGLDAGADDYVTKPFSTRELVSRVNAVLRRTNVMAGEQSIDIGGLCLDPVGQRITAHGMPLALGPTEFRLLAFFMARPERAFSREQLLTQVWGANTDLADRTIDVHIRRLRKYLEPHGFADFLQTVRGTGYRFSASTAGAAETGEIAD
jgi:two-component system phosphate regulon response regulator PhoB